RIAALLCSGLLFTACSPTPPESEQAAQSTTDALSNETLYVEGWEFFKADDVLTLADAQAHSDWQRVTLPHTPNIEPLTVNDQWQGDAWYRKTIKANEIT